MASAGPFAQVKAWASKTPEQALRIAGVLSLVENADAHQIEAETIQRAGELALWHLGEAVAVSRHRGADSRGAGRRKPVEMVP